MASDHRSQYPYLSDRDWKRNKHDPVELEKVNKLRQNDLEDKWANFSLSENNFNVESLSQSNARNELRLVIIGKTGQGKSATANTILGKDVFQADYTASSVTSESRRVTEVVDGRKISVMDTPGLQDTHQSNKSILKELARITTLYPDGVHAFIYVMNMADPRFTAEDKNVLDLIEKTFGGRFKSYCLLVFSHGDSALKDVDLDTYREKQMAIVQVTSGHKTPQNSKKDQTGQKKHAQEQKNLSNLLDELSWKMLAIDNKISVPLEKAHYRKQIVAMVDRMGTLNNPEIYTNEMFVKAQQEREAMRVKGLRKGWHPSVMSIVERIIAANPNISQEQLQFEVSQQLQKENVNKSMELQRKKEEFEKERIAEEKRLQAQKRIDEEKRQAEEKERKKIQEKEDKEREEKSQKEERERQELREKEDKAWQFRQEQQEIKRQNRFKGEEIERKNFFDKELEKHAKQVQLQRDEWERNKREKEAEFEMRQQNKQDMWEDQFREDKQQRQEQEDENLKRREKEESRRIMQLEREEVERRERFRREETELEKRFSEIKREELERQIKGKEEEQERLESQEEERKQLELHLKEQREERLQEMEELERYRKEKLEEEDLERQKKREQDDMERQQKWEREQEEKEIAEKERRQRAEEELDRLYQDIDNIKRLQMEKILEEQVNEIKTEHENILVRSYNGVVTYANKCKEWIYDAYASI